MCSRRSLQRRTRFVQEMCAMLDFSVGHRSRLAWSGWEVSGSVANAWGTTSVTSYIYIAGVPTESCERHSFAVTLDFQHVISQLCYLRLSTGHDDKGKDSVDTFREKSFRRLVAEIIIGPVCHTRYSTSSVTAQQHGS